MFVLTIAQYLRFFFLRVLTGLVVGLPPEDVRARILALPILDQAVLILAALSALVVASMLFALAGIGGPLALWMTLWLLVR